MAPIRYRTVDVDGFKIFYREAGPAGAPKLLLLHGFPTASHMFRDLIPLLATDFISSRQTFPVSVSPICRHGKNSITRSTTSPA